MSLKCSCKFQVDFGCILNDTEVMQVVKVTNHSPMDVKYQWSFIDSAIQFENKDEDEGLFTSIGRLRPGSLLCRTALWNCFGALTFDPVSCSSL